MKNKILQKIPAECPWRDTLYWYEDTDSTNNRAKALAKEGAPHGTVLIAGGQTGGRGRMGRSFLSPHGGVYLSVILRPQCPAAQLMHLTCAAGVAAVNAIEKVTSIRPSIKWINDLVYGGKKLGGILTELSLEGASADYAIVGIGINCTTPAGGFPAEVQDIATSLSSIGCDVLPADLAAALVTALWEMDRELLISKTALMEAYRGLCVTLGRQILVVRGSEQTPGKALDVDENGGLLVQYSNGVITTVNSGEVSVRGLWDYV